MRYQGNYRLADNPRAKKSRRLRSLLKRRYQIVAAKSATAKGGAR